MILVKLCFLSVYLNLRINEFEEDMNKLLANAVEAVNGILAVFLILFPTISFGLSSTPTTFFGIEYNFGYLAGLVVGSILAFFICGLLAVFVSMRRELVQIREILESRGTP